VVFRLHDSQIQKIDSIVKTVNSSYYGLPRFKTPEEKAAAYFCFIIKGHPVTDGNKRLSVLWLEIFTDSMEIPLQLPSSITLDILAVTVGQATIDHDELIGIVRVILFGLEN
jgi:prophage maintenance system killer protein